MANDISANPWKIDTPGASVIYAFPVKVMNINWSNYTITSAQNLVVQDSNGKDIVNSTTGAAGASGQLQVLNTGPLGWVRGIKVPTLTSGEVTISIGAGK
jgi:hypothetical protein